MQATATRPTIVVAGGERGVVNLAGARLLADLADATGLTSAFSQALAGLRQWQCGHDPGGSRWMALMLAGGEVISLLAMLRDQSG